MNRRKFLKASMAGLVTLATAKFASASKPKGQNYLAQVRPTPKGYELFLDGVNIQKCCREAHTGEGWADVYECERDANGNVTRLLESKVYREWESRGNHYGWRTRTPVGDPVNGVREFVELDPMPDPSSLHRVYGKVELRKVA